MTKRIILAVALLMIFNIGFADVIEEISKQFSINWTKGEIIVQTDMETHDYLLGKEFTDEIRDYKVKLKEKMIYEILKEINNIAFDENRQVSDIFQVFPEKETKLISTLMKFDFKDFRYYNKMVYGRYEIPIFGENSLFEVIKLPTIKQSYSKFIGYSEPKVYTGLLINVNKLDFKISLSPTIVSENGEVIYSYGNMENNKQHIHYFESLNQAISSGIFGDRIYYLFPKEIAGRNRSRIIISDDDVYRILSTDENFGIFELGKVGIITKE
jgi:hypothetical protein